jgi:hypothetical protein
MFASRQVELAAGSNPNEFGGPYDFKVQWHIGSV